jgi:hypothetical protein
MDRTDIHRPSAIIPADYEFVAFEYIKLDDGNILGNCAILQAERAIKEAHMTRTGGKYATHEHGGSCQVCGANAIYTVLFYHSKTNEYIRTGQDCAEKMEMPYDELRYNAFRKGITDHRLAFAGKRKAEALLNDKGFQQAWGIYGETNPEVTARYEYEERTIVDIVGKLVKYGSQSDRAINYIGVLLSKIGKRAEIEAQRATEAAKAADCPEGRVWVNGEVLSTKIQEADFGPTLKMLVRDNTGYKVWGTVPSSISVERGDNVKFSANVKPADDDKKFGYFSRPTKAEVVALPNLGDEITGVSEDDEITGIDPGDEDVSFDFEPTIIVSCTECGIDYDEKEVKTLDIEEGPQGEDILAFDCPKGHHCKSRRRG